MRSILDFRFGSANVANVINPGFSLWFHKWHSRVEVLATGDESEVLDILQGRVVGSCRVDKSPKFGTKFKIRRSQIFEDRNLQDVITSRKMWLVGEDMEF